jgi:hypothetical protein
VPSAICAQGTQPEFDTQRQARTLLACPRGRSRCPAASVGVGAGAHRLTSDVNLSPDSRLA